MGPLRRPGLGLAVVVVLGALARLALIWPTLGGPPADPDNYLPLARSLAEGRGLALPDGRPTAYRPPLYPIVLSNLPTRDGVSVSLWKVGVLHVVLGVATVLLTYLTARRMLMSRHSGPEDRKEIAPTVRSGIAEDNSSAPRSEGPAPFDVEASISPPGLWNRFWSAITPTLRSGLTTSGPSALRLDNLGWRCDLKCDLVIDNQHILAQVQFLILNNRLAALVELHISLRRPSLGHCQ